MKGTKTIKAKSPEELDKKIVDFRKDNEVYGVQFKPLAVVQGNYVVIIWTAMLFFD